MENQTDIDAYFATTGLNKNKNKSVDKRTRLIKIIEIAFPSIAAILLGLLIITPSFKETADSIKFDITRPQKGELEKLHIESSELFITDKNNQVNNFTADNLDETSPGSKLIKLTNPKGEMPDTDNQMYHLESPVGYYDQNKNTLRLEQTVKLRHTDGLNATTEALVYDFKKNYGQSDTKTFAESDLGTLNSQGFRFDKNKNLMIFTGKTHIVIKEEQLRAQQ